MVTLFTKSSGGSEVQSRMVVSRDESVCASERVKDRQEKRRKETKFVCASD